MPCLWTADTGNEVGIQAAEGMVGTGAHQRRETECLEHPALVKMEGRFGVIGWHNGYVYCGN